MAKPDTNDPVNCILCDYWLVLLGLLIVALAALLINAGWVTLPAIPSPPQLPPISGPGAYPTAPYLGTAGVPTPIALSTVSAADTPVPAPTGEVTASPTAVSAATAQATATTVAEKPVYKIVFLLVNWDDKAGNFREVASEHAQLYLNESGMENVFNVDISILDSGLTGVDLSSETLVADIVEYGVQQVSADLYIGLTSEDINLGGNSDVSGWTMGPGSQGVASEMAPEITSHEVGHVFGLCDEYSYVYWSEQNLEFPDGCPNPFPEQCSKDMNGQLCGGAPTSDGRNSFMGPSGMPGAYGYNDASLVGLNDYFYSLVTQANP